MTTTVYSKTEVDALIAPLTASITKLQATPKPTPAPVPAPTPTPVPTSTPAPLPPPSPAPLPTPTPTPTSAPAPTAFAAGQWTDVPNTSLQSVVYSGPLAASLHGVTGPSAIMSAWSGAAFDPKRRCSYVWGGGHTDYSGNEVYRLDHATWIWSLVTQPDSVAGYNGTSGILPNGNPAARHTYGGLAVCPVQDMLFETGGAHATDGGQDPTSWGLSLGTIAWKQLMSSTLTQGADDIAIYEPNRQKVLVANMNAIQWYDPSANTYTVLGKQTLPDYHLFGAIDTADDIAIFVGDGFLARLDLKTGAITQPGSTGDQTIVQANAPGLVYRPADGMFYGYAGGKTLYQLNPKTLVWTAFTPASGAIPAAGQPAGTFGRLVYDPAGDLLVYMDDIAKDICAFQFPLAGAVAQIPPVPNSVTVTHASGTVEHFATLVGAQAVIVSGDVISVSGSTFSEGIALPDGVTLNLNGVTLQNATVQGGVGLIATNGNVKIVATAPSIIQNVIGDGTAAGIRQVSGSLDVEGPLTIQGCDMGILSGPACTGTVIGSSVIVQGCGQQVNPNSPGHNLYLEGGNCMFMGTSRNAIFGGHELKCRAPSLVVTGATIDGSSGDNSRLIDMANGGTLSVNNSTLIQGPNTENTEMIGFAEEGMTLDGRVNSISITGNTIKTTRTPSTLIAGPAVPAFPVVTLTGNTATAASGFSWGVPADASNVMVSA